MPCSSTILAVVDGRSGPMLPLLMQESGFKAPRGESSDMPQPCFTRHPIRSVTTASISLPSGAAPDMSVSRDDKSYRFTTGLWARPNKMGGTACAFCGLYCSTKRQNCSRSNRDDIVTNVVHFQAEYANDTVKAYIWKNGSGEMKAVVLASDVPSTPLSCNTLATTLLCVNTTPFGNPVVPEEYGSKRGWMSVCPCTAGIVSDTTSR